MTAPGWYPSPSDPRGSYRWWDGKAWTAHQRVVPGAMVAPSGRDDRRPATAVAGLIERVGARAIDWTLAAVLAAGVNRLWAPHVIDADLDVGAIPGVGEIAALETTPTLLLGVMAFVFLWELYWLLAEGATPGKQLLGLYVLDPKSRRGTVEFFGAVRRNVHRPLQVIPFGWIAIAATSAASLVLMTNDEPKRQSLMDRLANTTVRRLPPGSPRFTPWLQVWLSAMIVSYGGAWLIDWFLNR